MKLSQFEETVRHGRGAHGSPAEPGEHGGQIVAAVEAVLELGQIARDVLVADRPIGADDRRLDVAESGVDPLEGEDALRPEPVRIGWWVQPAAVTPRQHDRPSLTTVQATSRLRLAKASISVRRKPRVRRSLRRTG